MADPVTPPGTPETPPDPNKDQGTGAETGTEEPKWQTSKLNVETLHAVQTKFELETPGPNLATIWTRPPNGWFYFVRPIYFMTRTAEQNNNVKKYVTVWKEVKKVNEKEDEYPKGTADNPMFVELSSMPSSWYMKTFKVFRIWSKKLGAICCVEEGGDMVWKAFTSEDDGRSWQTAGSMGGWVGYFHYGYVAQRVQQRDGLISIVSEDYTTDGDVDTSYVSFTNGMNVIRRPFGSPMALVSEDTIKCSTQTTVCAGYFLEMEDSPIGSAWPFTCKLYVWWNRGPYYPYVNQPNHYKPIFRGDAYGCHVFPGYPKTVFTGVMSSPTHCIPRNPVTIVNSKECIRWEDVLTWEYYWTGSGGSQKPGGSESSRMKSVVSPLAELFAIDEDTWLVYLRSLWNTYGFSWGFGADGVYGPYDPYIYQYGPFLGAGVHAEIFFDLDADSRNTYVRLAEDGSFRNCQRFLCQTVTGLSDFDRYYNTAEIAGYIGVNDEATVVQNRPWIYAGNNRIVGVQIQSKNSYVQEGSTKYFGVRSLGAYWQLANAAKTAYFAVSSDGGTSYARQAEINYWSGGMWNDFEWDVVNKYAGNNVCIFFSWADDAIYFTTDLTGNGMGNVTGYATYAGDDGGGGFIGIPRAKQVQPEVGPPDPNAPKNSGYFMYAQSNVVSDLEMESVTETVTMENATDIVCMTDVATITKIEMGTWTYAGNASINGKNITLAENNALPSGVTSVHITYTSVDDQSREEDAEASGRSITVTYDVKTIASITIWTYAGNATISNRTITLNGDNEVPVDTGAKVTVTYACKRSYEGVECDVEFCNIPATDRIYVSRPVNTILALKVVSPESSRVWEYAGGATFYMNIIYLADGNSLPGNTRDVFVAYKHTTWGTYWQGPAIALPYAVAGSKPPGGDWAEEARIFEAPDSSQIEGHIVLLELEHGLDIEEPTFYNSAYESQNQALMSISPTSISFAQNLYDVYTFSSGGGYPPITWSMIAGSLPNGLTWNSGNVTISGTPTETGQWSVTLQAEDSWTGTGGKSKASGVVTVSVGATIFKISPSSFSSEVNKAMTLQFTMTQQGGAGAPPYTWTLGGSVPTGTVWNKDTQTISGTPTAAGSWSVTATVTDSSSPQNTGSTTCSITITEAAP